MYRYYQEKLYQVLTSYTFFRSQVVALAIGRTNPLKDWQTTSEFANTFLRQYLPACIVRESARRTVPPSTLHRYGVETHPLYVFEYRLFRHVLAVFDSYQE